MSGHSKWHQIKHKKAVTDHKKGKLFGWLAREILVAARDQPDPMHNAALREVIGRARAANMPQANIDRLLSREKDAVQEVLYEGFGPAGSTFLIRALTDNPNRTVAELKTILKKNGGGLGVPGSVRWQFDLVTTLLVDPPEAARREAVELALIEASALEIEVAPHHWLIRTVPEQRPASLAVLARHGLAIRESTTDYVAQPAYQLRGSAEGQAQIQQLTAALAGHNDVVEVATNATT